MKHLVGMISGMILACTTALSVAAADFNDFVDFYDFIDFSDGYIQIRPDVLMIEGEEEIRICKFDVNDAMFAAYAANDQSAFEANRNEPVCIPILMFLVAVPKVGMMNAYDFNQFVDESENYENLRRDVLLIEGEEDIKFCKFDINDRLFAAFAANDHQAMEAHQPSVVCIPMSEVLR